MQQAGRRFGADGDGARPCEGRGAARCAYAPHRGGALLRLGTVVLALGLCSVCLLATGWLAVLVAAAVEAMAGHDLGEMAAGRMDPGGWGPVEAARERARWGGWTGTLGLACGVAAWLVILVRSLL
jgi:hypothetical protein